MDCAFRIYNNGTKMVFVVFPKDGGGSILRKSWSLDTLCLNSKFEPNRKNMPYGTHKIPSRKSLVRGGFNIKIDNQNEMIVVTPKNRQGNELPSKSVSYRFEDLGLEYVENGDMFSRSKRSLSAKLERNNKFNYKK